MKNRKIIVDMLLSIFASIIPIFFLQLFALPLVNRGLNNPNEYGLILTLISLITMISRTYGNTLNNVRLIMNQKYLNDNEEGDFNLLLIFGGLLITIILLLIIITYNNINIQILRLVLVGLVSITLIAREYYIVAFRLELNYKKILLNNFVLVLGYFVGYIVFIVIGYWEIIYLVGQVFSLIFIMNNTKLFKEKYKITRNFKETTYKTVLLNIASMLSTVTSYADKILLYPLLGGVAVAIYYSSTLLGKIVSLTISPISNVLLSYLSKKTKISMNTFYKILFISISISIIGYFVAIAISKPILILIYPEYTLEAMKLIPLTTASAMITLIIAMIDPLVMKFRSINWQLYVNFQHMIIYILLSMILTRHNGIIGFALSILISLIIKLISLIVIYIFSNKKI